MKKNRARGPRRVHATPPTTFDPRVLRAEATWRAEGRSRWLQTAYGLAIEHSLFLHGDEPRRQMTDVFLLGTAAAQLWDAAPGAPAWSNVDLDAYLDLVSATYPDDDRILDSAYWSLQAFVHWLRNTGRITPVEAEAALRRFDARMPAMIERLGICLDCGFDAAN